MSACPCGSGRDYGECCGPLLEGRPAESPEALMRSRYTAFTLGAVDYLLETHHPRTRAGVDPDGVARWAASEWLGLTVVEARGDLVSFEANYRREDGQHCHRETSRFARLDDRWYYLDGVETPVSKGVKVGRNEPCPCGSGKKFKKCCGG